MIKFRLLFLSILLVACTYGQVTIIGHNKLNNEPVGNTTITIKEAGLVTKTLSVKAPGDFMLKLDFGKRYSIYFENPRSPMMYMEVIADGIPEDKYIYKMVHELNIPLFDKNDADIDTAVLRQPFYKMVFDGKSKMVSDSVYNNAFYTRILKDEGAPENTRRGLNLASEKTVVIAGQIILNNDPKLAVNNKIIDLVDKSGRLIGSTTTNRFGAFSFSHVNAYEAARLKMELKEVNSPGSIFTLVNSKGISVNMSRPENGICTWELNSEDIDNIIDNNYTISIGGKIVCSSPKLKKFLAGRTVYLSNKYNTVIKKTTTTVLGTFVFEDLKPDNTYLIGVDKKELGPGEKLDLLNKDDKFISTLDTLTGGKVSLKINSSYNKKFNDMSISNAEMTMNLKATIYGDNTSNPIGKLKVILLNDTYQVIDSAVTDDFGAFKFKYLPFLKRFYLSAENSENILDVFNNILIYNKDYNLVKIMTHEKGTKFSYKPVSAEIFRMREVEMEDPWLEFIGNKKTSTTKKMIVENILFDNNSYEIRPQAQEILDKVILVMQTNKKLKIEIGAYTDSKGSEETNLKLSQMRARTVLNYITAAGVDAGRIISKGYGESKLLNNCDDEHPCNELEHARNRRIEFTILEE